ncbi:MAG: DEAD/DEAH box helicase [Minicystis sp.]
MAPPCTIDALSPSIQAAFAGRGFSTLTPIQEAVLDPELAGRDLRIFSQTGSGKTVAVGLAMAPALEQAAAVPAEPAPAARPFAVVIAPTRELATQIGGELSWLFAPLGVEVAVVTGGTSYGRELSALRRGPRVIAGTPGRLLDHLDRGSIDPSALGVVVLDEADQMLDLGFKDELDAILARTPPERRTILLSATYPREVQRLADRCQRDPVVVAGAGAGQANEDITHVAHLVAPHERDNAVLNLLLMAPSERALVFVRTREGASELADRLSDMGLPSRAIHGDLEQRDRTRTLDAFRTGRITTLVATDVAARGIDVPDVTRVIHADLPGDAEVLTHRSGRTGRAGKKGTNVILVPPAMHTRARMMLRRARVEAAWSPAPTSGDVMRAADERLVAELTRPAAEGETPDPRLRTLAERLLATASPIDSGDHAPRARRSRGPVRARRGHADQRAARAAAAARRARPRRADARTWAARAGRPDAA